jgi:hypothetical protein
MTKTYKLSKDEVRELITSYIEAETKDICDDRTKIVVCGDGSIEVNIPE